MLFGIDQKAVVNTPFSPSPPGSLEVLHHQGVLLPILYDTCSVNLKINVIHVNYSLMTHCNTCEGWVGVLFIILKIPLH